MSSILRAFEILEKFRQVRRPLSLNNLVREFGYPTSTIADILKTLSHAGYISFDSASRTYFPTTRLGELGDWIKDEVLSPGYPTEMPARPLAILQNLRRTTGLTALLGVQNDLEVLYLAVLESAHAIDVMTSGRRTHRPLIRSGVGCALLSLEGDDFIERIYRRSIARGMCDVRELPLRDLMARVESCRRDGFVFVRDFVNPRAAIVAMPVSILYHGRRGAVAIGGPTEQLEARIGSIAETLLDQVSSLS